MGILEQFNKYIKTADEVLDVAKKAKDLVEDKKEEK